jgi:D-alanyl-D-alanine carboxypeptidase (penicillin-binding protein 5/6)
MIPTIWLVAALALLPGNGLLQLMPSLGVITAPTAATAPAPAVTVPIKTSDAPLRLTAGAVYAIDRDSGQVLYQRNAGTPRAIASITKLATAIVIVHNHELDDIITVPDLPTYQPEDELLGLVPGEQYRVRDLLAGLLVQSGNDAADTLAIADSGSLPAFSAKMNRLMSEWGVRGSRFSNPSGLSDTGNAASAQAVAQIGQLALHNSTLRKLVDTGSTTMRSQSGRVTNLAPTNQLLQSGRFNGIKTGYTLAAGQCFIGLTTVQGHEVVTVILGSQDRFGETLLLTNWINRNYSWL